jgi:hypothetical protein
MRLWQRAWRLEQQGDWRAGRALRKQMKTMPSRDPNDPNYRRLRYCRYADLCRCRHKSHYAEHRIMPTAAVNVLVSAVDAVRYSA